MKSNMGTNYYLRYNICKCCGRFNQYHIGKDSGGWKFLFHIDSAHKNIDDWLENMRSSRYEIYDEYDNRISYHDFIFMIRSKQKEKSRVIEYPKSFTTDEKYDYSKGEFS